MRTLFLCFSFFTLALSTACADAPGAAAAASDAGEAAADAAPELPADASTPAAAWCSQQGAHAFCADFDGPSLTAGFVTVSGTFEHVPSDRSAPYALGILQAPNGGRVVLEKTHPISAPRTAKVVLDLRVESGGFAADDDSLSPVQLAVTMHGSIFGGATLFVGKTKTTLVSFATNDQGTIDFDTYDVTALPHDRWVHVELALDLAQSPGTITLAFDDACALGPTRPRARAAWARGGAAATCLVCRGVLRPSWFATSSLRMGFTDSAARRFQSAGRNQFRSPTAQGQRVGSSLKTKRAQRFLAVFVRGCDGGAGGSASGAISARSASRPFAIAARSTSLRVDANPRRASFVASSSASASHSDGSLTAIWTWLLGGRGTPPCTAAWGIESSGIVMGYVINPIGQSTSLRFASRRGRGRLELALERGPAAR